MRRHSLLSVIVLILYLYSVSLSRDFAVFIWSDTHIGGCQSSIRDNIISQMNACPGVSYPSYLTVLTGYTRPVMAPAFLIHLGDITENAPKSTRWDDPCSASYKSYIQCVSNLTATNNIYEIMGNHDYTSDNYIQNKIAERHGNSYYSFEHEGIFFIMLNPYKEGTVSYPALGIDQLNWIQQQLGSIMPETPLIFAMHISPDYTLESTAARLNQAESTTLYNMLVNKNVLAFIIGHWHTVRLMKWNNIDVLRPAGYGYAIGCTSGQYDELWAVLRITNNRIDHVAYDWLLGQWGTSTETKLTKTFVDNTLSDLDNDESINNTDLSAMAASWLSAPVQEHWNEQCDIAPGISDQRVNFLDFAVMASKWKQ